MSTEPRSSTALDAHRAIPDHELVVRASRASGAGGQHVNTSSTRVEVVWNVTASEVLTSAEKARLGERLASRLDSDGNLRVVASDTRSQSQNRELALGRLAALVRKALLVPRARKATKPSRASKERRLEGKKRSARKKRERRAGWED